MTEKFTRAEVAEHNSNKDVWMIIGNKVFDVTKFLDEHPGGCEVLLEKAGEDRTEAFEDIGHSSDARTLKEDYLVGEIVDEEKWQYSYDKKPTGHETADKNGQHPLETYVFPVVVVAILGLLYYLFS
ncbi:unnamed protein product [Bursaphelenchus okinawaensis]|uniref:Cytochrome b5 n=1 Tax=Bursaphelenchus okinawaensis TaxID=465554 RepID=A0A811LT87_9BILA|nr:unnamed protein product [Bursaphelenchus okinawaensis]CAG9128684.1 unnamed protein product [Bursaphelenchus okinawaensis]